MYWHRPHPVLSFAPLLLAAMLLAAAAGCSAHLRPLPSADAATLATLSEFDRAEHESLTWSPSLRHLKGAPWLAAAPETRLRLEQVATVAEDSALFAEEATNVLEGMLALAEISHGITLKGLGASPGQTRPAIQDARRGELARLASLSTAEERSAWTQELIGALPPEDPHGPRIWRKLAGLPAAPFIYGWMAWHIAHEWAGENWRQFEQVHVYRPDEAGDAEIGARLDVASEQELLRFFAPVIVQEAIAGAPYDSRVDRLGAARLIPGGNGHPLGRVDVDRPTVYAWTSRALVQGRWLLQLNYAFWYPRHAEFKPNDPEAGSIEGQEIRITLDGHRHPLLAEAVYACGCYHRVYPEARLAAAAGDNLVRPQPRRIDAIVPESAGAWSIASPHPLVYVRSGFHLTAAVRFQADPLPTIAGDSPYRLGSEHELHTLPWQGGFASFFGPDGLVRGADRPEATFLYPTGIYHAGTPRQSGIQFIHFDQYRYDDPTLLDTLLRIPATLLDAPVWAAGASPGPAPRVADDARHAGGVLGEGA